MDCTVQSPKSSFCKKSLSMSKTLHITKILFLAGNQGDWLGQQQVNYGQGTKSGLPPVWVRPYCWYICVYIYIYIYTHTYIHIFYIFDGWKKVKLKWYSRSVKIIWNSTSNVCKESFIGIKPHPLICFCIICSCFCDKPTLAECNSCHRHHVGSKAKIFTIRPFTEKSLWTPEKKNYCLFVFFFFFKRISLRLEV